MASVVVCGGSVLGLMTALLLDRDGHDVVVLEADPAPVPAPRQAWDDWNRSGVAQFHQPHNLFPGFQQVLDAELPEVTRALVEAGCVWQDPLKAGPPGIDPTPQPGDERFRFVTGRRPVVEAAFARVADGLDVRRGVRVAELLTGPAVVPGAVHVVGVRDTDGNEHRADLVVDAMGRTSPLVDWLTALGRPPQVQSGDCGFLYYTRYFTGEEFPPFFGPGLSAMEGFSLLTLRGDNLTWSVTVFGVRGDTALKAVRDNDRFDALVRACPLHAQWLDGTPISDVLPMAGVLDRYRRFVVEGAPVVTGLVAVGDAWACTNPSAGRGLSVGAMHVQLLRDVVRRHAGDPEALARAWDAVTEERVAPWFHNQVRADTARIAELEASRDHRPAPAQDRTDARFWTTAMVDAEVFRGLLETVMCLALPEEVLARPSIVEKMERLGRDEIEPLPGPTRAQVEELLS
jgi:2-polyprenyl-6-methoxyphenol hydroxylase-like FAD-dependent oxidoreductase